jgi:hypothetical protein
MLMNGLVNVPSSIHWNVIVPPGANDADVWYGSAPPGPASTRPFIHGTRPSDPVGNAIYNIPSIFSA